MKMKIEGILLFELGKALQLKSENKHNKTSHSFHNTNKPQNDSKDGRRRRKGGMSYHNIITFGQMGVGKTAFIIKFASNHFVDEAYDPTIEDAYRKQIVIDDYPCSLDIYDAVNDESYLPIHQQYLKTAEAAILFYSISSRSSFEQLSSYRERIERFREESQIAIVVVATKCDLTNERQVEIEEGQSFARSLGGTFFETSAKNDINVKEPFEEAVRSIRRNRGPDWNSKPSSKKNPKYVCFIL